MLGLIKDLKAKYGIHVQYPRCDNAGESEDFQRAFKQEGMGEFECTEQGSSQQNNHVKLKFAGYMPCSTVERFLLF